MLKILSLYIVDMLSCSLAGFQSLLITLLWTPNINILVLFLYSNPQFLMITLQGCIVISNAREVNRQILLMMNIKQALFDVSNLMYFTSVGNNQTVHDSCECYHLERMFTIVHKHRISFENVVNLMQIFLVDLFVTTFVLCLCLIVIGLKTNFHGYEMLLKPFKSWHLFTSTLGLQPACLLSTSTPSDICPLTSVAFYL